MAFLGECEVYLFFVLNKVRCFHMCVRGHLHCAGLDKRGLLLHLTGDEEAGGP